MFESFKGNNYIIKFKNKINKNTDILKEKEREPWEGDRRPENRSVERLRWGRRSPSMESPLESINSLINLWIRSLNNLIWKKGNKRRKYKDGREKKEGEGKRKEPSATFAARTQAPDCETTPSLHSSKLFDNFRSSFCRFRSRWTRSRARRPKWPFGRVGSSWFLSLLFLRPPHC